MCSQCAPVCIQSRVLEVCRNTIKHVSSTLRSNFEQLEKAEGDDVTEEDGRRAILLKLCQVWYMVVYWNVFIPFLYVCLQTRVYS